MKKRKFLLMVCSLVILTMIMSGRGKAPALGVEKSNYDGLEKLEEEALKVDNK